jgi:deoxyadenosine/deoxycytidine kinase
MIILLSGPTGSGKSSFATILGQWGYSVVRETIPEDIFQRFRVDPVRNCASLQEAIIRARIAAWNEVRACNRIVFDRSIDEDVAIFCQMHFENGLLTRQELDRLSAIAREAESDIARPDLTISMSATPEKLLERLKANGHPNQIISSLPRQLELYRQWTVAQSGPVLQVDNTHCTLESLEQFLGSR